MSSSRNSCFGNAPELGKSDVIDPAASALHRSLPCVRARLRTGATRSDGPLRNALPHCWTRSRSGAVAFFTKVHPLGNLSQKDASHVVVDEEVRRLALECDLAHVHDIAMVGHCERT